MDTTHRKLLPIWFPGIVVSIELNGRLVLASMITMLDPFLHLVLRRSVMKAMVMLQVIFGGQGRARDGSKSSKLDSVGLDTVAQSNGFVDRILRLSR